MVGIRAHREQRRVRRVGPTDNGGILPSLQGNNHPGADRGLSGSGFYSGSAAVRAGAA